jgi:hypothetical protein
MFVITRRRFEVKQMRLQRQHFAPFIASNIGAGMSLARRVKFGFKIPIGPTAKKTARDFTLGRSVKPPS